MHQSQGWNICNKIQKDRRDQIGSSVERNTPCSEKSDTLDFCDNFCKCTQIFKISSLPDSQGNSLSLSLLTFITSRK